MVHCEGHISVLSWKLLNGWKNVFEFNIYNEDSRESETKKIANHHRSGKKLESTYDFVVLLFCSRSMMTVPVSSEVHWMN